MPAQASRPAWIITCEHAGNRVPAPLAPLFEGHADVLASHRGWDPGALGLARTLARRLAAPLFAAHVTRLVVDANRTQTSRTVFSEFTRPLPEAHRERLLARIHRPHRARVAAAVGELVAGGSAVVHVAAHSFTPVLRGVVRDVDVGLLFDPARPWESRLVDTWVVSLRARRPDLRIRRNSPYRGTSDGLPTTLRHVYPHDLYAGIEIEVNQAITTGPPGAWRRLQGEVADVLADA